MPSPIRVAVTGAAGNIGYALVYRIANGDLFGPNQPVILHMLEITPALKALEGVAMELDDCAFPLLAGMVLSDDANTVRKRVMSMYTDPNRVSADVPGKVEGNPVFAYHDFFNPNKAEVEDLKERYLLGKVGDVEVKEKLAVALNNFLEPTRERRAHYESMTGYVDELIYEGTLKAREEAKATMIEVKKAMGLTGVWNKISRGAEKRRKKETS
mgnify:CR=1 FL=1